MNTSEASKAHARADSQRLGLTLQERRGLVGHILAEHGVKVDIHDPSVIVVDLCVRALDSRLAQINNHGRPPALSGLQLAEAVTTAYTSHIVPKLQATVHAEFKKALESIRPTPVWAHPAFVAAAAGLAGVIVGFLLRSLT